MLGDTENILQVGLMVGLNVRSKADIYRTEPKNVYDKTIED